LQRGAGAWEPSQAMTDAPPEATRQTRVHRGHRIVAVQLGTIHAPDGAIVGSIEGASAPEVVVRGVGLVYGLLAAESR
jgi:hypothetical protein